MHHAKDFWQTPVDTLPVLILGTCPGLYSGEQLQELISQMMPGGVQIKRPDKIDQAFDRFLKKVRQNLHVIVCLNYRGISFQQHSAKTIIICQPRIVLRSAFFILCKCKLNETFVYCCHDITNSSYNEKKF